MINTLDFRALFESVSEAIIVCSEDGKAIDCNAAALALFCCSREQMIGSTPVDWSPALQPDGRRSDTLAAEIIGRVLHGETIRFDWTNLRGDGTPVEVAVTVSLIPSVGARSFVVISRDITAIKATDRELARSEERFRNLFERSPDPCWLIQDRQFIDCNLAAVALLGYASREELLGTHPSKLSPEFQPDGRPSFAKAEEMMQIASQCGVHRFEWAHQRSDGSCFPVEVTLARLDLQGHEVLYCIWRDISERKRIEADLVESQEQFRGLSEAAFEAIFISEKGRCLQQNQSAEKMFGYSTEEAVGRLGTEWIVPEDRALVMKNIMSGYEQPYEVTGLRKDGSSFPALVRGKEMHFKGRLVRVTSMSDISERKAAEVALRDSEERWKFALEGAGDGVWDWNIQTGEALFSRRWKEMIGFAESEIGNNAAEWSSRVHLEDMPNVMAVIQAHIDGKTPSATIEFRMLCKDGHWLWTLGRGMVVSRDADGQALRLIGTNTDISERKRIELDLQESEATFRRLFEESSDPILLIDSAGVFVECNQAALVLLRMTREQFLLLPPAAISPEFQPDGRRSAEAAPEMIALAYRKGSHRFDWTCVNAEGGEFIVEVSLMPVAIKGQTMLHTTWRDITERKASAERIEHLAFYDPLTDLPNRRLLIDRLEQALSASARHNRYGALMLLDMDDFKTLNDTLGHDVGDQFLVEVARRLQSCVREGDTVARFGGDEFVVILEDLKEDALAAMHAESVAVKILSTVSQPYLLDLTLRDGLRNTRSYHCTSSIGITLFQDNSLSVDELIKRADTAMYQAKAAGRNALRFFDPEMQAVVTARATLDNDLREALREGQFCLHYQIQVDCAGRRIGAEALVRWLHPQRGMVSPAEFIPQAEITGLILPLGDWVLETACVQLVAWAKQPEMAHLVVAVNVSARQFHHVDFVSQVLAIIERTGANPLRLKLELTESLLLDDVEDIIAKMGALKARGVSFALDDFGTGYSSLSYLKRLPLDQLKIDRSFVRDVLIDPNDAAIARTIIALAQSLGLSVIAEGVESAAQHAFLVSSGCEAYQGYLFGRPMPAADLAQPV